MPAASIDIDRLILDIHAASLSQDEWPVIIRNLMAVLDAESAAMHGVSLQPRGPATWGLLEGADVSVWRDYAAHWAQRDVLRLAAQRSGRLYAGCVNLSEQLIPRREFVSMTFYNEFMVRFNADHMVNVCLTTPSPASGFTSALSFFRGVGRDPFSSAKTGILTRLAPHLVVAATNFFQSQSLHLVDSLRRDALDSLSPAVLGVDRAGHLVTANLAGEQILRQGGLLRLTGGMPSPGTAVLEAAALARALAQLRQGIGGTLLLTHALNGEALVMTTAPTRHAVLTGNVAGLIWLIPAWTGTSAVQQMADLFGLTAAEQRLLQRLADGDELTEAARLLGVSVHTVRNQLKSIFHKTGLRTQARLLQMVSQMAAIHAQPARKGAPLAGMKGPAPP